MAVRRGRSCRSLGRKAYKELICLGYGKKGPLFDQFSLLPESTLDPDRRHKALLHGVKFRVKSCNAQFRRYKEGLFGLRKAEMYGAAGSEYRTSGLSKGDSGA